MTRDPLRLGRIKKVIAASLGMNTDDDLTVYILAEEIDAIASSHPDDYLNHIELLRRTLREPDYVSTVGGSEAEFYRLVVKGDHFAVATIRLEKHGKWICVGFIKPQMAANAFRAH